jgi:hypothetical protein
VLGVQVKHVILGAGEVGSAIGKVLRHIDNTCKLNGVCQYEDPPKELYADEVEFMCMHVCFPFRPNFVDLVNEYSSKFCPGLIIVHSTVKPGTTKTIDHKDVVYSPIRGRHADLWRHVLKSTKYYCGTTKKAELKFEKMFEKLTLKKFSNIESLEFAKVASTTYYGWCLLFMRSIREECERQGYNFNEVYTEWNRTYNEMVDEGFQRPIYKYIPGPIGGHCVLQNLELLGDDLRWMKDLLEGRYGTRDSNS